MGNASQVNIGKWGRNLLWHRLWYTSNTNFHLFQKTQFVDSLIHILFRFGSTWTVPTSPKRIGNSRLRDSYIHYKNSQFNQYYRYRQFKDDLDII